MLRLAMPVLAEQVLGIATRGGARVLGFDDVGTLEKGMAADLCMVEMDRLDYAGALADPLAAIIFSGMSHQVDTTIVNGQVVVQDGMVVGLDEEKLRHDANRHAKTMLEKAGHSTEWIL